MLANYLNVIMKFSQVSLDSSVTAVSGSNVTVSDIT